MTDKDRARAKPEIAEQATTNFGREIPGSRQNSKVKCTQMFGHGPPRSLTTDWLQPLPPTADYPSQEALMFVECRNVSYPGSLISGVTDGRTAPTRRGGGGTTDF